MQKQKFFITGAGSPLLTNFIRKAIFENLPYEFISIDRCSTTSVLNNVYSNKSHKFYIGDTTSSHFLNVVFEFERPDIVCHGAFNNNELENNILSTKNILEVSSKYNIKKFIYLSTNEIYGSAIKPTENSILNPTDSDALSKLTSEFLVKNSGLNYNILRFANIYGSRQPVTKLIPKLIKSINNKETIDIYSKGAEQREWLHLFDACFAMMHLLKLNENNEIFNITSEHTLSNIEIAQLVCNLMNKGHDLIRLVDSPDRAKKLNFSSDGTKFKELGWVPKMKVKAGLEQTVNWFLENSGFLRS